VCCDARLHQHCRVRDVARRTRGSGVVRESDSEVSLTNRSLATSARTPVSLSHWSWVLSARMCSARWHPPSALVCCELGGSSRCCGVVGEGRAVWLMQHGWSCWNTGEGVASCRRCREATAQVRRVSPTLQTLQKPIFLLPWARLNQAISLSVLLSGGRVGGGDGDDVGVHGLLESLELRRKCVAHGVHPHQPEHAHGTVGACAAPVPPPRPALTPPPLRATAPLSSRADGKHLCCRF
jgi:hypothetical protein